MPEPNRNPEQLQPQEYRALYEISRVILKTGDVQTTLRELVRLARPVFIFDNVVLYELRQGEKLIPTYARSVGRGRSTEADMAWGEAIAQEVFEAAEITVRREVAGPEIDGKVINRLDLRYFLGFPLYHENEVVGALVFIRFGGPEYTDEQIELAGLITEQVEHLLTRQLLVERVADLEAEKRFNNLQEQFVATVSHDLRSPLGFIKGYATSLLRDDANWDPETRREFLSIIDEETDRLTEIIDNLLDSSRLQAGSLPMNFQEVDLAQVLQDFVQRMQLGDFDLDLQMEIEDQDRLIMADSARIVQVMSNLISNAEKYAPGSRVIISLEWEAEWAHICVRDTGPGIPPEHLDDIFDRLYRLPRDRDVAQGTGLGLFICKEIVQAHGGKIFARSALGEGTRFHLYLPARR